MTVKEDIVCYKRSNPDTNLHTFKAEVYYNRPPSQVARYLYDNWETLNHELMPDTLVEFRVLKEYNENVKTSYSKVKVPGPVSPRDTTSVTVFLDLGGTYA